jgi:hypothetical protein
LTYAIKASTSVPQTTIVAVENGIAEWNTAIDSREADSDWDFDIVPLANASTNSKASGPKVFSHRDGHNPPGRGGGGGGEDDGAGPDLEIQIKKGGGVIAGSAQRSFADGFTVGVKIQISGGAFGLANGPASVKEVTMHEVGHGLALGHHTNEADLMGPTVGYEGGGPSACDLDGFEAAHQWLTDGDDATGPAAVQPGSVTC